MRLLSPAAALAGGIEIALERIGILDGTRIPPHLETGQQLDGPPFLSRSTHSVLSDTWYLDQFCFSVFSAVVSSARQDSLLRPATTEPLPAASQLVPTFRAGGLAMWTRATLAASAPAPAAQNAATTQIVQKARAVMAIVPVRPVVRSADQRA
jgi:hypothetical protein